MSQEWTWQSERDALLKRIASLEHALTRLSTAEARLKELESALTGLLRVWDEVCKAVPPLTNQPEAVAARVALEG